MSDRRSGPIRLLAGLFVAAGLCLMTRPAQPQEELDFQVTPQRICEGETVEVRWAKAEDRGVLLAKPPVDGIGEVPEKGSLNPTLRDTTEFRMLAIDNGDTTRAVYDVAVFRDRQQKQLAFSLAADGDTAVAAEKRLSEDVWSPDVRIRALSSSSGRPIHVLHGGEEAVLGGDGSPVDTFHGLPFSGTWVVRSPILPGEELGQPDDAPPTQLSLTATILCQ